jgi:hypothetical protein
MNEATKAVVSWYKESWQKPFVKRNIAYQIKEGESRESRADIVETAFCSTLDEGRVALNDIKEEFVLQGLKQVDWDEVQESVRQYLFENREDFYPVAEDREVI